MEGVVLCGVCGVVGGCCIVWGVWLCVECVVLSCEERSVCGIVWSVCYCVRCEVVRGAVLQRAIRVCSATPRCGTKVWSVSF